METNIIKDICRQYKLTYKELGNEIGYGEEAISKSARTQKLSAPLQKACDMFLRIKELESKLEITEKFKKELKEFLNS